MAVNYAEKYSDKVDERFKLASLTQAAVNEDYDWEGVQTVNVYSVGTAPLNDYQMTGTARYGTADELGTDTQAMTLTQDKSFTFTIDRKNYTDQMMVTEAGKALRRQTDEVIIPTVDMYRIARIIAGAGNVSPITPITAPYEAFLTGTSTLLDKKVPLAGTFAFISTNFYKGIRLDNSFIQASDMAQEMLVTGQVGKVENIPLVYVPTSYFPAGVEFVIANRIAVVGPVKLADYRMHSNPPGVSGWLCEGRVYYDTFVLGNKANAIYVHKSA